MKILASDYDGTLFIDEIFQNETLQAIREWRKAGNQFGIVTGRDILMTKEVVLEHNIPVDFLICNNGCALYRGDFQVIHTSHIPQNIILDLIESAVLKESAYIVLADGDGRYVYDDAYTPGKYPKLYYTEVLNSQNIGDHKYFYQMDTRYPDAAKMHQVREQLEQDVGEVVTINPNITTIDITPKGVTKLTGLQKYIKINRLEEADIIPVGDGLNDLPMIRHYKGYTMEWAVDEIKNCAKDIVSSVQALIKKEL